MPNYAIYARVSTAKQSTDMQVEKLKEIADDKGWDVTQTILETVSGSKGRSERKGLDELLKAVTRREIHGVMVWSVDRLGRSMSDLISTMTHLNNENAQLYMHTQGIDTTNSTGRAMFGLLSVFAEFERSMIQERVRAGLEVAKAKGKTFGRPKLKDKLVTKVEDALKQGYSVSEVQKQTKASRGTVSRIRQRLNADGELTTTKSLIKVGTYSTKNIGTTSQIATIDLNKVDIEDVKEAFSKRAKPKTKPSKVA